MAGSPVTSSAFFSFASAAAKASARLILKRALRSAGCRPLRGRWNENRSASLQESSRLPPMPARRPSSRWNISPLRCLRRSSGAGCLSCLPSPARFPSPPRPAHRGSESQRSVARSAIVQQPLAKWKPLSIKTGGVTRTPAAWPDSSELGIFNSHLETGANACCPPPAISEAP